MPCNDERDGWSTESKLRTENKKLSAMLCGILTALQNQELLGQALEFYDERETGVKIADLRKWWETHKAEDAKRKERERLRKVKKLAETEAEIKRGACPLWPLK